VGWCPDLSTEAKCRALLGRDPENFFVRESLAALLQSQGREEEASQLLSLRNGSRSLKYDMGI
jgi:hypothetical protein